MHAAEISSAAPSVRPLPAVAVQTDTNGGRVYGKASASCTLDVYDMDCAACAILIESELRKLAGVASASVHYATQRARIAYDAEQINEAAITDHIVALGHTVRSNTTTVDRADIVRGIRRRFQWQTGLAAFCAMQIMMFSLPRYLGADEVDPSLARLMDGAALALTLPVLIFCAGIFFRGARRELRIRRLGMDTAVAVSLVAAFAGSLWHVWSASGQLYFDSIAMFVALLLGVRWFEWEQREANRASLERLVPSSYKSSYARLDEDKKSISSFVDINQIQADDLILIGHLQSVPVDGYLERGPAQLDESVLSGESTPTMKTRGAYLNAGSINLGESFVLRAQSTAQTSTTQRLLDLADQSERPAHRAHFANISRWFVPTLFALATLTLIISLPFGVDIALERAIAVLIVSCPCALALAAPAANARAFAQLASIGIIVRRGESLDRLASVDTLVFDKTGTLTDPHDFRLARIREDVPESRIKALVASLEVYANHPLATSLRAAFASEALLHVSDPIWKTGRGVSGTVDGVQYRLGRWEFASEGLSRGVSVDSAASDATLYLSDRNGVICAIEFLEPLRSGAQASINALKRDYWIEIMSGDRQSRVDRVASILGIAPARGDVTAREKEHRVQSLQRDGRVVAMIGDGWNDSVAFAKADVSIAASGAIDAALRGADLVCAASSFDALKTTFEYAKRLRRIIRENYVWAIAYNAVAVPFAALGYVDPIYAAIGMAASSAFVVMNTMRLNQN